MPELYHEKRAESALVSSESVVSILRYQFHPPVKEEMGQTMANERFFEIGVR
jgi:hypothetical protein